MCKYEFSPDFVEARWTVSRSPCTVYGLPDLLSSLPPHGYASIPPTSQLSPDILSRSSTELPFVGHISAFFNLRNPFLYPHTASISELKEQERLRNEKQNKELDISYLQDAPNSSLAGRLARATASKPQPEPHVPRSREDINRQIEKRRAARIARQTAQANEALGQYKPNPLLEKVASAIPGGRVPGPASQKLVTPQANQAQPTENSPLPKNLQGNREPLVVQLEEPVQQIDQIPTARFSLEPDISSRKDRKAAYEKKLLQRQRKQQVTHVVKVPAHMMKGVERRREERLRRERVAMDQLVDRVEMDGFDDSSEIDEFDDSAEIDERPKVPKKEKKKKARVQELDDDEDLTISLLEEISLMEEDDEEEIEGPDLITSGFTGPEPISATLAEYFQKSPVFSPSGKTPLVSDYSSYVPASTDALFSKPIGNLSAVETATIALSHRADIGLRKRKEALASIAASTRSRSSNLEARA